MTIDGDSTHYDIKHGIVHFHDSIRLHSNSIISVQFDIVHSKLLNFFDLQHLENV